MPKKPPPARRPPNSRLQTYISGHVHEQVDLYCAQRNWHESTFFETASLQLLDGTGDKQLLYRRLDQIERRALRTEEATHAALILVHEFVGIWFERAYRGAGDAKRAHREFMEKVAAKARASRAAPSPQIQQTAGDSGADAVEPDGLPPGAGRSTSRQSRGESARPSTRSEA